VKEQRYASKKTEGSVPVVLGDSLYMLMPEKVHEFMAKAYQYIGKSLPMPLIKPNILLLGRPKSGKTSLAKSLAHEFDILYISMTMVLNAIVQHADDSLLTSQVAKC
jgi:ATP-dependent protease Clp ATPase subunit